jgi:hypothetical protein
LARRAILLLVALLALALPSAAPAAQVVNGGFESGTLAGWEARRAVGAGKWFAYKGTEAPIGGQRGADPVQAPPQGTYAAIADQANPDTLLLFQDLQLEPGSDYRLTLQAFYDSYAGIAIPSPDTLSVDEEAIGSQTNQQFRIDLVKPEAPLDSISPSDVLLTLFRTKPGAPRKMKPTLFGADLAPFAGQTVRLRIAVATTEEVLNAGVDAVSLSANGGKGGGATERLRIGKRKADARHGIVRLSVQVPSEGRLTALDPSGKVRIASKGTGVPKEIVLPLRPTAKGKKILADKQRMRVKIRLRWTAGAGSREIVRLPVVFKLRNP